MNQITSFRAWRNALSIGAGLFSLASCAQSHPAPEPISTLNSNTVSEQRATAVFASGCFWGTEYYFKRQPGVVSTTVGYIGGQVDHPTYKQVCTGTTGHYEATLVEYDPTQVDYETLARLFFETHDPNQQNGQGPDIGPQYRSAIFYTNDAEKATAEKLIRLLRAKGNAVATVLLPSSRFWPAEDYHQDYYDEKGGRPYCHKYTPRF
ncbi:peptide-methionine (S)-S-oxide reductase MsrA [bacterium]|nr:peptide-methionine (S)-S-oxide reductase MsrA [bacterium]